MTVRLPRHYWPFLTSTLLSNFADGVAIITITVLASRVSNSPADLGLVLGLLSLPWVTVSLFSGVVIDRLGPYLSANIGNLSRALVVGFLIAANFLGPIPVVLLGVAAFTLGIGEVLSDNSHSMMLPSLIDERLLERANNLSSTAEVLANRFLGVNLGSVLMLASSLLTLAVNGALFLLCPLLLLLSKRLSPPEVRDRYLPRQAGYPQAAVKTALVDDVLGGIRYLFTVRSLFLIMCLGTVWNLMFGIQQSFYLLYLRQFVDAPEQVYAWCLSAAGIGGILGGVVFERLDNCFGRYRFLTFIVLVYLAQFLLKYLSGEVMFIVCMFFLEGFCDVIYGTIAVSFRQRTVPREIAGRATAGIRFVVIGSISVGSFIGGSIASAVSFSTVGLTAGLAGAVLFAALLPGLREIGRETPKQEPEHVD